MKRYFIYIFILLAALFFIPKTYSSMNTEKTKPPQSKEGKMITLPSPGVSPLEIITAPKTPRQPAPRSDGADNLVTWASNSALGYLAFTPAKEPRRPG